MTTTDTIERPDIEAIRRRLDRNEYRRLGDDWHDPQDLRDIRALLGEVERLNQIIGSFKAELNSELQRSESMALAPSFYPKAYVDGRARTAIELIGFLNGLVKNDG